MIGNDLMRRHCLGIAATGGGKSNFLNLILKQQMMRGGGAIHIDGKSDDDAIRAFLNLARQHDRWHDVRIINIDNAQVSNTYNPLLRGDADEMTSRLMALIDASRGDPFFRGQASRGLNAIAGLIRRIDKPFNFGDLNVLMGSEGAMRWLLQTGSEGCKDTKEFKDYRVFMDQMMQTNPRTGAQEFNEKKLQHTFGDLSSRLHNYYVGPAGSVLNSYNPEVDLYQALKENLLIYVALPMLKKAERAIDFAKLFVSDLKTVVGQIQNEPLKPNPPFLVLMDEFSSYAMPTLAPLFEQARSSNVCLFPFIQTTSSLTDKERGLSTDFAAKIVGNTWNKVSFVLQDRESQEKMSELAGEMLKETVSEGFSQNISFAGGEDDASILRTGGRGQGYSRSISMKHEAIARPEDFRNLADGEAIYIGRSEVIKIKIPLLTLDKSNKSLDFPRFRMPQKQGLAIAEKYHSLMGG